MKMTSISSQEELARFLGLSREKPLLLFKHSTACPISSRAYSEVEQLLETTDGLPYAFAMIVVQEARPLSNKVAELLGIQHESPQAIVVRNGRVVWTGSHFEISREKLEAALRTV